MYDSQEPQTLLHSDAPWSCSSRLTLMFSCTEAQTSDEALIQLGEIFISMQNTSQWMCCSTTSLASKLVRLAVSEQVQLWLFLGDCEPTVSSRDLWKFQCFFQVHTCKKTDKVTRSELACSIVQCDLSTEIFWTKCHQSSKLWALAGGIYCELFLRKIVQIVPNKLLTLCLLHC